MGSLDQTKSVRIAESIENQIRESILSEKLEAGNRLPSEHMLANLFGTSRVTIREALRTLERDGFVEIKQGVKGGAFVRKENATPLIRFVDHRLQSKKVTLENLTEARLIIEPEIAVLAANRATVQDIARLESALNDLRQVLKEGKRNTATNIRFHRIIGESSKNPVLHFLNQSFLSLLQENLSRHKIELSQNKHILEQHTLIFEAIKDRNPDKAYTELRNHILFVKNTMKLTLFSGNTQARSLQNEQFKER
jgi:GntR family transcriptional repressor for pyruvate dehydrogenase complex